MTPLSALRHLAENRPGETAFVFGDEVWSYRRLASEAEKLARGLQARGVGAGDRIALHMYNLPELVVAYCACFRLGAIASPLNTRFKTAELEEVVKGFEGGLRLDASDSLPLVDYVGYVGQVKGLQGAVNKLGAAAPATIASAVEFVLEGLHLSRKLNKDVQAGGGSRYRG